MRNFLDKSVAVLAKISPGLLLVWCTVGVFDLRGQTIFIPGGTSGIGTSSSSNVGINTSSPGSPLDIEQVGGGNYGIRVGRSDIGTVMDIFNDGAGHIESWSSNLLINGDANTNVFMVEGGGKVGIGTGSPSYKLDINGSANVAAGYGYYFGDNASESIMASWGIGLKGDATHPVYTPNASFLVGYQPVGSIYGTGNLLVSGNVGIGTTGPQSSLDVIGTVRSEGFQMGGNPGTLTVTPPGGDFRIRMEAYDGSTFHDNVALIDFVQDGNLASGNHSTSIRFSTTSASGSSQEVMRLDHDGIVYAQEVEVTPQSAWPDYVFSPSYRLAPLAEVEKVIKSERHLPGVPSALEVAAHGVKTGEMEAKLLAKVEELTLHLIAQEKRMSDQEARITRLERENSALRLR